MILVNILLVVAVVINTDPTAVGLIFFSFKLIKRVWKGKGVFSGFFSLKYIIMREGWRGNSYLGAG